MKLNTRTAGRHQTTTFEGGKAYTAQDKREALALKVLTTFFNEPKFYVNTENETADLLQLMRSVIATDPSFAANLARYARNVFHMRTVSQVLAAELAAHPVGKPFVRQLISDIAIRPDDLTETLAWYLTAHGKPIPNSLKKGLADAFGKFDEYQLQKYNRKESVQLKDILAIAHPRPQTIEQSGLWKKLLEDSLATPYTWETVLSERGNNRETWEELIDSGKLGYMALLRNLRNIIKNDVRNIDKVIETLESPEKVKKSRQLPFRFYSAAKAIEGLDSFKVSPVLEALEEAINISVENIEKIPGKTLVVADDSGSMSWGRAGHSTVTSAEIAALLMLIAHNICEQSMLGLISTKFRLLNRAPRNHTISETIRLASGFDGGGTNIYLILEYLLESELYVDRLILVTDDQGFYSTESCQSLLSEYRRTVNPNIWMHIIDTEGYGPRQFIGEHVTYVGGWSEKVFKFIPLVENGISNLVQTIRHYA